MLRNVKPAGDSAGIKLSSGGVTKLEPLKQWAAQYDDSIACAGGTEIYCWREKGNQSLKAKVK